MLEPSHQAADQLVAPPLMREFVRRDEIRQIDIRGLLHAGDESDPF